VCVSTSLSVCLSKSLSVCVSACQEFDVHMDSDGHAANMKVMSAVYHDKNQQLLSSSFDTQKRWQPASARR